MKTLILSTVVMTAAIAGFWSYARTHADSSGYVHEEAPVHGDSAPVADEGDVIIRVNGRPITQTEFELALASFPENARAAMVTPAGRKVVAEELVRLELLSQKAESEGLADRDDVRDQLRRSRLEGELVRKNVLAQAALREMLAQQQEGSSLQTLYEELRSEFETADTRQVVVGYAGSRLAVQSVTRSKAEARSLAEKAAERLRAGDEFATVLDEYGDNPDGADLGSVRRDSTPPDFADPIFSLEAGGVSDPVETPWGYHVFQVTARNVPTFEELEPQLRAQSKQLWTRVALENLRESADVELDEQFFGDGPRLP